MNFLAHAYLSFDYEPFIIGNMISDFVKGKKMYDYETPIQKGIELHRKIDDFTDAHPIVKEAKQIFKPKVGLYAGAFTDVVFDYFLANDTSIKTPEQWEIFSEKVYKSLSNNVTVLPQKFLQMLPYMVQEDWLYNYRYTWGIKNSFHGLQRRAKYLDANLDVFSVFENNIPFLEDKYQKFFPQLYLFVTDNVRHLLNE